MITITGTTTAIKMLLLDTTIGTCEYTASIFDATGEVLHDVVAVNGTKLQWITASISLVTAQQAAIDEIARLRPAPERNPDMPPPDDMSEADKLVW